jgi:hypothetical protein
VETIVSAYDERIFRDAIRRELPAADKYFSP